ncbi:RNA polymerase sigma factor [Streptomyces sp. NPDC056387]|uniref:RNA polymerase sigma factor n=1 Tax=Streptomyces sp. NPDC056387 TaxID=3345803 RepID=UPI0035D54D9E
MTSFTIRVTPCLNCGAPVDLLDPSVASDGEEVPAYRNATCWCGRCMRYMDDWERFYLLYQPRVYRFCLARLKGILPRHEDYTQAAEDISQETMIVAHEHFHTWDRPERALWWTARRKIYKKCATYRIVTKDGLPVTVRHVAPPSVDGPMTVTADPAEAIVAKVVLHSAISSKLTVPEQEALMVHKLYEVPAAEAGRILGRPATTVKSRAQQGMSLLKEAAAKGALVILPGGAAIGLYKILEHIPFEAAADGAVELLTQPQTYPVMLACAAKYVVPYLRERYRALRERSDRVTRPKRELGRDETDRHRGRL